MGLTDAPLFKNRISRSRAVVISEFLVLVIGAIDYAVGSEISFAAFYILPIAMAAWFVGESFAVVLSIESVAIRIGGDLASGLKVSSPFVPIWNAIVQLLLYLCLVKLLQYARLFQNRLETRMREKGMELREEMTARDRLERQILEVSERERRRLGYDLHDGLCQHLTGTAFAVQVLKEKLKKRDLPEAGEAANIVSLIEEGIAITRSLAKGLQPVGIHTGALEQALQELATATGDLFKLSCRFDCDTSVTVSDVDVADHLYRIAQEAVGNAVKHGRANNIVISLEASDEGTILRVADDGVGIPVSRQMSDQWAPVPRTGGMGLRIMTTRARAIGAKLDIGSGPRTGTLVSCCLPDGQQPWRT